MNLEGREAMKDNLSVVIPAKEVSSERLKECLEALGAQRVRPEEVVVVLPKRALIPDCRDRWQGARFVRCPNPPSFCRAVNAGIAATGASWVLLLNDDVVMAPDCLERLLGGIPADERIGMVCGRLLSADGRRIDSTGQFLSRAWTARERGHRSPRLDRFNVPGAVFSVPGALALYRRSMLEAIALRPGEYFDERFGTYLEDLELGCRAQRAGWRAYYAPQARARHRRGATAKTRRPRWPWLRRAYLPWLAEKLQARYVLNRYRLMASYATLPALLARLPWVAWYEARLWVYLIVHARPVIRLLRRSLRRARRRSGVCQPARLAV